LNEEKGKKGRKEGEKKREKGKGRWKGELVKGEFVDGV